MATLALTIVILLSMSVNVMLPLGPAGSVAISETICPVAAKGADDRTMMPASQTSSGKDAANAIRVASSDRGLALRSRVAVAP